ncbi:MAG: hypothetical protein H7A23_20550 [Leptospiraceae bacterium]|nr:hypothetical protein [Leptospiraceae bacterium]
MIVVDTFLKTMKCLVILLLCISIPCCSTFQFQTYNNFWEWYKGKPGLTNTLEVPTDENGKMEEVAIEMERHPFYLGFRTPELIFNPQRMYDKEGYEFPHDLELPTAILIGAAIILIVGLIAYTGSSMGDDTGKIFYWFGFGTFIMIGKTVLYISHDVVKTITIPVAGVYYSIQDDGEEEEE